VLLEAHLAGRHRRPRVTLRWSQPVRILHRRRVRFLGRRNHGRQGKLISPAPSATQTFAVPSQAAPHAVAVPSGVAVGPGGPSTPATVTISPTPASLPAPTHPPTPTGPVAPLASSFIDSVGMNIHAGYFDTTYVNSTALQDELVKLGVHYVRDGAWVRSTTQRQVLLNLAAAGIKTNFLMAGPGDAESLASKVDLVAGPMRPAVASIEGPNEYDFSGDPNWVADLRSYQQELYQGVTSNPQLAGVPVLGPSLGNAYDAASLGDLSSSMDQGNLHPYPGGQVPDANMALNQQLEASVAPGKPTAVTETGYTNGLASGGGNRPLSEQAAAAYVPRAFLDNFNAGITRTYLYELMDEKPDPAGADPEQHFGLIRTDYSEKPAFRTLQTLLSSLAPASGAFARSSLSYRVASGPADLRHLLLQTGPDSFALVLWRDVSTWDLATATDLSVASQAVSVSFGSPIASITRRKLDDPCSTPLASPQVGQPVSLSLNGMPAVLQVHGVPTPA
jgi:hypothetical protein